MRKLTVDHGVIIHFAGAHHLFPVARKDAPAQVRLAAKDEVSPEEQRVGWPAYFEPFNHQRLVFVIEGDTGRAMTKADADALELPVAPKLTP